MIKRPLLWIALSYMLGCLLYPKSWVTVGSILFIILSFLSILYVYSTYRVNQSSQITKRINKEDRFLILLPIIILIGYGRMQAVSRPTPFDAYCEKSCTAMVEGTVNRITKKTNSTCYELKQVNLYPNRDHKISITQKIIAYGEYHASYQIGNRVRFTGTVSQITKATNEGQFDSATYYSSLNIRYQMYAETMELLDGKTSMYAQVLKKVRQRLCNVFAEILPSKEAGIMQAMLLGEKQELTQEMKELYQENGISHILAISGLHISFLGLLLFRLGKRLRFPLVGNVILVTVFILSYGIMTDFSVSTNRAIVMLLVSLFALLIGRTYDMLSAISLSGGIILLQNPMQLYNAGFQLSFMAVLVLAIYGEVDERIRRSVLQQYKKKREEKEKKIERERKRKRKKESHGLEWSPFVVYIAMLGDKTRDRFYKKLSPKNITNPKLQKIYKEGLLSLDNWNYKRSKLKESNHRKALLSSLLISAGIMPILAYSYGEIPLYSTLLNLLIIPLSSVLLIIGLLAGIVGVWWIGFAKILGSIIRAILLFYETLCHLFSKLPYHLILTGRPTSVQVLLYSSLVILLVWYSVKKQKHQVLYLLSLVWILLVRFPDTRLTMTMLDVSQGDSIFIQLPTADAILVDGGSSDVKNVGTYRIKPFLKAKRVANLSYVILTHMDEDHINGIEELMEQMPDQSEASRKKKDSFHAGMQYDGTIWIANLVLPKKCIIDDRYREIVMLAKKKGITLRYLEKGNIIRAGGVTLLCRHPYEEYKSDSRNDTSIVLDVSYGKFDALLLGDLESGGESELIQQLNGESQKTYEMIKIAHHGSKYSSTHEFLTYYTGKRAWISCGYGNDTTTRLIQFNG
ncbi:ComEC/Rec2 family competence protein [Anaerosporobacter faecicola]|uniref:ComEC/Rec2 family competence protein n=1 Tax=Anaerosporobacter faecicola TaxID=2718714 RepID=UPI001438E171|nr:ComEC/Rec2 family competence protein [Anaerosporobacter faecicola]